MTAVNEAPAQHKWGHQTALSGSLWLPGPHSRRLVHSGVYAVQTGTRFVSIDLNGLEQQVCVVSPCRTQGLWRGHTKRP